MPTPRPLDARANNFGLLRLLFAALVIVSHSPELVDGNRSRELLTRAFGTMSFGEVAVDGFFLISGFLITQSFARTPDPSAYVIKRIARIVPAFLVCSVLCVFVLAPFVGAGAAVFSAANLRHFLSWAAKLLPPEAPVFQGMHYPVLNGATWTIAYEARCYIAVAILGLLFRRRPAAVPLLAVVTACALAVMSSGIAANWQIPAQLTPYTGQAAPLVRFAAMFSTGALFFLYRNRVKHSGALACVAAALLLLAMPHHHLAEPAYAIFGGYLIFIAAFSAPASRFSRWADRTDISYGLYLYAWAVGSTFIFIHPTINPWLLCGLTLAISAGFGIASWRLIEQPVLRLAHRPGRSHPQDELISAPAAA